MPDLGRSARSGSDDVLRERLRRIEHNSWLYQHEREEIRDLLDDDQEPLELAWQVVIFEDRIRDRRNSWEASQ